MCASDRTHCVLHFSLSVSLPLLFFFSSILFDVTVVFLAAPFECLFLHRVHSCLSGFETPYCVVKVIVSQLDCLPPSPPHLLRRFVVFAVFFPFPLFVIMHMNTCYHVNGYARIRMHPSITFHLVPFHKKEEEKNTKKQQGHITSNALLSNPFRSIHTDWIVASSFSP